MPRPMQHRPESILGAAARLLLSEGVGVSTARIAAEAGVSNGTLFNYFPTKQALIDALYVSAKQQLADAISDLDHDTPVESRMRSVWSRWLHWARGHRTENAVMNLLVQAGLASEAAHVAVQDALSEAARLLDDAIEADLFVALPPEYLAALVQQHIEQAIVAGLDDAQSDLAFSVLWNGITR